METVNIPVDKTWAVELSEEEFSHEFQRRNPIADFIPKKANWLGQPEPVSRGIDGVRPDDLLPDDYQSKPKEDSITTDGEKKKYYCRGDGCDRTFDAFIGKVAHERRCRLAMNTKL
jgi:hypothetical protein